MKRFNIATRAGLDRLVRRREGETKFGEKVQVLHGAGLQESSARFVLLGIPEDIGVRANEGVGGAHTLWEPALKAILNVQETERLAGETLLVLGAFDFSDWMSASETLDTAGLRALVSQIDDAVYPVIRDIVAAGKIPIVIGGGHNNAYPLLKGAALAHGAPVNCINLDPHSDYRVMEGRHSGNGFRYARHDSYLARYSLPGLHRSYNSRQALEDMRREEELQLFFYEDIFLTESWSFRAALRESLKYVSGKATGIELDLDSIAGVLCSAATPCGISTVEARQYLVTAIREADVAYVHLAEGAVRLRDGRTDPGTAKLAAYLVSDLVRQY